MPMCIYPLANVILKNKSLKIKKKGMYIMNDYRYYYNKCVEFTELKSVVKTISAELF